MKHSIVTVACIFLPISALVETAGFKVARDGKAEAAATGAGVDIDPR